MRYKIVLILLLLPTLAFAISVDRTVLVPRQSGIFTANVHAALNPRTTNTLVIWEKHPGTHAGHSIWGMLLSRNGTPAGTAFQIVSVRIRIFRMWSTIPTVISFCWFTPMKSLRMGGSNCRLKR